MFNMKNKLEIDRIVHKLVKYCISDKEFCETNNININMVELRRRATQLVEQHELKNNSLMWKEYPNSEIETNKTFLINLKDKTLTLYIENWLSKDKKLKVKEEANEFLKGVYDTYEKITNTKIDITAQTKNLEPIPIPSITISFARYFAGNIKEIKFKERDKLNYLMDLALIIEELDLDTEDLKLLHYLIVNSAKEDNSYIYTPNNRAKMEEELVDNFEYGATTISDKINKLRDRNILIIENRKPILISKVQLSRIGFRSVQEFEYFV